MEQNLENRSATNLDTTRSQQSQAAATQAIRDVKPSNRAPFDPEAAEAATGPDLSHEAPTVAGTAPVAGEPVTDDKEAQRERHLENARQKRAVAANAVGPGVQKLLEEAQAEEDAAAKL